MQRRGLRRGARSWAMLPHCKPDDRLTHSKRHLIWWRPVNLAVHHIQWPGAKLGYLGMCRWNFTPSPGWTKEEAAVLKLCLMKYGVGKWVQILETGLLPGKLIQQLNGQAQRLLGQQSLAGAARLLTAALSSTVTCNHQESSVLHAA